MLENVEIAEQKQRNEAYKAAKKKTGVYDDSKFNEDPGFEKKMLPKYDDPVVNEGVILDERGGFCGEADKKLEELRKRIDGASVTTRFEDLTSPRKVSTDYYTSEEMMKLKKPKKKNSLRKKDKLDIEALVAEAWSAGLGTGDRGSRADGKGRPKRRSKRDLRLKREAMHSNLHISRQMTHLKPCEWNKLFLFKMRMKIIKILVMMMRIFVNHYKAQEKLLLRSKMTEHQRPEGHNPDTEDVLLEEDVAPPSSDQELKGKDHDWAGVKDIIQDEKMADEEEEVKPDATIHESSLGKGLSGALQLLTDPGTLKNPIEWSSRNMEKRKGQLVGLVNEIDGKKEICIERTDEYGRSLTPKEAFRSLSHKFHGKGPGKMKQEKRMSQYHQELKLKQN